MSLIDFIQTDKSKTSIPKEDVTTDSSVDTDYYNMLDPDTGYRFAIPMLDESAPGYYFRYIYHMKLKERSPETFNAIMNWS